MKNFFTQLKLMELKWIKIEQKESKSNKHFYLSLLKSFIRIGACMLLIGNETILCGFGLILAEIIGILEEL